MPEDERLLRAGGLAEPPDRTGWLALLRSGQATVVGRMPWSSNATFLVELELDGAVGRGVYKPGRGERPLRDFPDGIYRREVAAYELDAEYGLDVIPETVVRTDAPYGEGSIQRFVDADFEEHYFSLFETGAYDETLRRLAGFDLLLNNADRKGGHVLRSVGGALFGIDNGLSFHAWPKLRTVMWDYAGQPLPAEIVAAGAAIIEKVPDQVAALLDDEEVDALRERAREVRDDPRFPFPDPNRRTHPWPLV